MKVIVNRSELAAALTLANATIAARSPKPILQCVLLEAKDNKLSIYATDLETSIHSSISQVQIEMEGRSLAPADKLLDIIKNTIDDTVTLLADSESIRVVASDSNFKMFKSSEADYPAEPSMDEGKKFALTLANAQELLGRVACAVARIETKNSAFNGTLFKATGKTFEMVATDGRRLAHTSCDLVDSSGKTSISAVVPPKALSLVSKLVATKGPKGEQPTILEVTISPSRILFESDDVRIGSSIIEGEFPPYEQVIPKDADKKFTVGREEFLGAVRRAGLFAVEDKSNVVRFDFTGKGVHLSSADPSAGDTSVTFPGKFEGANIEIGFNCKFMIDGLNAINDPEIKIEMTAPARPGLLCGERFRYVIMPVNLKE